MDVVVLAEAAAAEPAVAEDRVSGLDPGRYELTLDVADRLAGRSLTAREEFMLEPAPEAGEAPSR